MAEFAAALASADRADLAAQLASAIIESRTYDPCIDAGHLYFVRPRPSWYYEKLSHPVAQTISFDPQNGLHVDVDHDGHLFAIEYLGRADVLAKLRQMKPV